MAADNPENQDLEKKPDKTPDSADKSSAKESEGWLSKFAHSVWNVVEETTKEVKESLSGPLEKTDSNTLKSAAGDTIHHVDKEKDKDSVLYKDWDALFGWASSDKKKEGDGPSGDKLASAPKEDSSWLKDYDWGAALKSAGSDASDKSKGMGILDWFSPVEVGKFLYSQAKGSGAADKGDYLQLDDGSKIYKDGSIEFSEATARAMKEAKAGEKIVHEYTDAQGHKGYVEIVDGKVMHRSFDGRESEVTKDKIRYQDGKGNETRVDKLTGNVDVTNDKEGLGYHKRKDADGKVVEELVTPAGTYVKQGDQFTFKGLDGSEIKCTATDIIRVFQQLDLEVRQQKQRITQEQIDELRKGDKPAGVTTLADNDGNILIRRADGTTVWRRETGEIAIILPDGAQFVVKKDGSISAKSPDGQVAHIDADNIPKQVSEVLGGELHKKDGKWSVRHRRLNFGRGMELDENGTFTAKSDSDPEQAVTVKANAGGGSTVEGPDHFKTVTHRDAPVDLISADGKKATWNQETHTLTTPEGVVMAPNRTILWNQEQVLDDGTIIMDNGDRVNPDGSVDCADGTHIDPDGTVHTPDGWKQGSAAGREGNYVASPEHTAAMVAEAEALAASVSSAMHGGSVDWSRISALSSQIASMGTLAGVLTAQGDMPGVIRVWGAQALASQAVDTAIRKAQGDALGPAAKSDQA